MEMLLDMENQNSRGTQEILRHQNKEYEKTQKKINELIGA
jgi:hypothetical protein